MYKLLISFFVLIFFSVQGRSQSEYYSVWLDYNHSNKLKENWFFESDYGYRFRLSYKYNWQRLHARTGIGYSFKKVKVIAGLATFAVFEPNNFLDFEIRPWQGVKYSWKISDRFKIYNFARLEERIHYFGTSGETSYNYFLLIFRYSLTAKYAFNNPEDNKGKWVGFIGFEPFVQLYRNENAVAVTKSRTTLGLEYSVSKKTKFKLGYIYEPKNIPLLEETILYSNNFRLSVVQKF